MIQRSTLTGTCPIEDYVEVVALTMPDEPRMDQRIVNQLVIMEGKFKPKD
jgi:hypothetical protein